MQSLRRGRGHMSAGHNSMMAVATTSGTHSPLHLEYSFDKKTASVVSMFDKETGATVASLKQSVSGVVDPMHNVFQPFTLNPGIVLPVSERLVLVPDRAGDAVGWDVVRNTVPEAAVSCVLGFTVNSKVLLRIPAHQAGTVGDLVVKSVTIMAFLTDIPKFTAEMKQWRSPCTMGLGRIFIIPKHINIDGAIAVPIGAHILCHYGNDVVVGYPALPMV